MLPSPRRRLAAGLALLLAVQAAPVLAAQAAPSGDAGGDAPSWDVAAPPVEGRDVTIDVTEGTWMSLDVSPDGRTIAFDLLGDIYLLPIEGGEARPIATGLPWEFQPRFSPDGTRIAFTSDRAGGENLWVMNADGSDPRAVTDEDFRLLGNPDWHPSGDYLVARKHFTTTRSLGTGELWLYPVTGGDGVALVERPDERHQKELGEPAFSPDGRYLYYSLDVTPGPIFRYAQDSNGELFRIRRYAMDSGEITDVVSGPGGAVRPEPSPDGRKLAFVRRVRAKTVLFVKDLESGALTPLFDGLDKDMQEVWAVQGVYPNMAWTPDSERIVFWAGGGIHAVDVRTGEVEPIPFHVRDTRRVLPAPERRVEVAPDTFRTRMARFASVSPDGARVVFESLGRLYLQELPDGRPRRLTRDGGDHFELYPAWSRDGTRIAFVTWDDEALGTVRTVAAGGGRSRVVTERPGHYVRPAFSPDGETLVFEKLEGGYLTAPEWSDEPGVHRVPAAGGRAVRVVEDGARPHFGADGERIFLTRRSGSGPLELVSVDRDGHEPRVHAKGELVTGYRVAPDGRHVLFTENYQVFAAPLPPGAATVDLHRNAGAVPVARLSGDGAHWPHWSGGERVHWVLGPELFRADVAAALAAGDDAPTPAVAVADLSREVEAPHPDGAVALVGARIVTMADGDGGVIEDGTILIEGNRIAAVGPRASVTVPRGTPVVELAGRTVLPGLIDAHAHGAQGTEGIVPQQNWRSHGTLAFGVTTVFDPSNDSTEIFAAAEMQRAGVTLAPRIWSTGRIVYGAKAPGAYAVVESLEDAREHVRRLAAQGAIAVKNYNQPRRDQRQQVTHAGRLEGLFVVPEGGALFHMDLSLVADGNSTIEHNVPQNVLYEDVLRFWAQTGTGYTPTFNVTYSGVSGEDYWYQVDDVWKHPLLTRYVPAHVLNPRAVRRQKAPEADYVDQHSARQALRLAERGVSVHIGAHGQREGLGSHWELWSLERGGATPVQALASATILPARQYGMDADVGSLEPGKLADLFVVDGNPLERLRDSDRVTHVMLDGRLYDAATLDETVTGDRRREPYYWED
jgi:imidazolonepropionase-like amidohydrolase/Tol biopolymer transport system component